MENSLEVESFLYFIRISDRQAEMVLPKFKAQISVEEYLELEKNNRREEEFEFVSIDLKMTVADVYRRINFS